MSGLAPETNLLARMLFGITETANNVDPEAASVSGRDFERIGERGVSTVLTLESGDTYRVTVEWLPGESP